jgi:glutamine amidotransferase
MSSIAVIDYGMGNLRSVTKALEHVADGARVVLTHDAEEIRQATHVVFPGQGAARECMAEIRRLGLDSVVSEVASSKPFLGICMGLQVLMDHSDENDGTDCLGLIHGQVRRFAPPSATDSDTRLKVPQMGWNQVHQTRDHPLWRDIAQDSRFYFVHSYYVAPVADDTVAGRTRYGIDYAAVLATGSLFAVQFHPEKSQRAGLTLLANFVRWDGKP